MNRTRETIVQANGVELCVETFGDSGDPAILLTMGGAASMDWWEPGFCERLAAGGRFVVRYDNRDTGRSVSYEPGAPPYTLADMAADAVGILDVLGVARAHLAGMSMGATISLLAALDHPERVASLTLISASPGGGGLPPMSDELRAAFAEPEAEPDWSDREAVIDYVVEGERPFAGSRPLDEAMLREIAGRAFDRTENLAASMANHGVLEPGEPVRPRLGRLTAPTLVVHGAEDPLFPIEHGEALAAEIPGARLLTLEGTGHELPRGVWDVLVPAILEHTSQGTVSTVAPPGTST